MHIFSGDKLDLYAFSGEEEPNRTDIPHLDEEEKKYRYTNCAFRNDDEPNRSQSCIE